MINLYMDKMLELSSNQAITGTTESDNSIDFGTEKCSAAGKRIDIRIKQDFASGSSLQFVLQDSEDGIAFTDKLTSTAFTVSSLKSSGTDVFYSIPIPKGLRRFIRLKYVALGTFTKGKIHAALNTDINI